MALPELAYLHGVPQSRALLKQKPEDFIVEEDLGFELSGEGEHLCVQVQKRNCNTQVAADALARWAKVPGRQLSYAGLKDKQALTTQWFSIHLPGKADPDLGSFNEAGMEILALKRHNKKIKTGALKGNYFKIKLTELDIQDELSERLQLVKVDGVPNYFGSQRFGHQGLNIEHAKAMFAGSRVKNKKKRGIYLSAARSLLFNLVVSERLKKQVFNRIFAGELLQLVGSNSFFASTEADDELQERINKHELVITAPLWGKSKQGDATARCEFENTSLESYKDLQIGLEKAGLEMARRAILLKPQDFEFTLSNNALDLSFYLPAGCYATSVIREILNVQD